MKQVLGKVLHSLAYLAICGLIGYYNFMAGGWISIATNLLFLIVGILLAETWGRKKSVPHSEKPSSSGTGIAAQFVDAPAEIAKEAMSTDDSTPIPQN